MNRFLMLAVLAGFALATLAAGTGQAQLKVINSNLDTKVEKASGGLNLPKNTDLSLPGGSQSLNSLPSEIVRLTNLERQKAGLKPLAIHFGLGKVAVSHADNMARQNKMSHVLDGKDAAKRLQEAGYPYKSYGENIAAKYPNAQEVVKGWMNSPGHRKNILNPNFVEFGVGVRRSAGGDLYFCQVFGARR
jgi:uncharacterized protein YkwD